MCGSRSLLLSLIFTNSVFYHESYPVIQKTTVVVAFSLSFFFFENRDKASGVSHSMSAIDA